MYEKNFYFLFQFMFLKKNGGSEKMAAHLPHPPSPVLLQKKQTPIIHKLPPRILAIVQLRLSAF